MIITSLLVGLVIVCIIELAVHLTIGSKFIHNKSINLLSSELESSRINSMAESIISLSGKGPMNGDFITNSLPSVLSTYYLRTEDDYHYRVFRFSKCSRIISAKFKEFKKTATPRPRY